MAAVLAATASAPAIAQGDPGKMFMINAVTPGVVSFSGEGTAQFNNSSSTSNAFSVGSATQFGVNASASATADYMVDANALLQLGAGAQLQQTIGTSSSAANTMAAAESAATAASSIANRKTTEEFGQNWVDYSARNGATITGSGDAATVGAIPNAQEFKNENAYNANKKAFLDATTSDEFSKVTTAASQSSSQGASGNGVISGEFKTNNSSTSQIGASASASAENTSKASQDADSKFGTAYSEYTTKFASVAGAGGLINTEAERLKADSIGLVYNASSGAALTSDTTGNNATSWEASKKNFSDEKYSALTKAAQSSGTASNESNATVTVTGVGSIATLNASPDSAFNVDVATRIRNQLMENNATANGSAGGSLNTVSMANQSNTQSASAFMQAFGADTVKLTADSTGQLVGATVNGRFDVTLDAAAGKDKAGLFAGTAGVTGTPTLATTATGYIAPVAEVLQPLQAPVISVPKSN